MAVGERAIENYISHEGSGTVLPCQKKRMGQNPHGNTITASFEVLVYGFTLAQFPRRIALTPRPGCTLHSAATPTLVQRPEREFHPRKCLPPCRAMIRPAARDCEGKLRVIAVIPGMNHFLVGIEASTTPPCPRLKLNMHTLARRVTSDVTRHFLGPAQCVASRQRKEGALGLSHWQNRLTCTVFAAIGHVCLPVNA